MKILNFIFIAALFLLIIECAAQKKVQYNIPEHLSAQDKKQLKSSLKNGLKLYKANCTSCHGIFAKGQDGIPDFTQKQVEEYKIRFLVMDPFNHAVMQKMTAEDLNAIISFFKYRKIQ